MRFLTCERLALRLLSTLCLLWLCANLTQAMPLSAYRERVQKSADALDTLLWSGDEESAETMSSAGAAATLREVRQAVLTVQSVEAHGTSLRVDNSWLDEALKDYERMSLSDSRRAEALLRIEERLSALSEQLALAEGAKASAHGESKDEEKARLAAILRRAEYQKNVAQESALTRLMRRISNWLRDLFPNIKPINPGRASKVTSVTQYGVFIACLAVIVFLFWRYGPQWFKRARRKTQKQKREARVVLGERLEPDQTAADLLAEAEALARSGDLRAAIRKGYIALLCELGDRKILSLAQSKTNRDYLRAVQHKETLHSEMRSLTDVFENHWYGLVPASPGDWSNFRAGYQQALKEM